MKFFDKLNDYKSKFPIAYYHWHGIVSVAIMLVVILISLPFPFDGLFAGYGLGMGFYIGREIRDLEKLGFMDWHGLIYPMLYSTTTLLLFILLG